MSNTNPTGRELRPVSFWIFVLLAIACMVLNDLPFVGVLITPVRIFVTTLHEMGHAFACLATGGSVAGMTIVSDGDGHGGLTFCRGGIPFIYSQTGYLGCTFFGCLLIWFGRLQENAKTTLVTTGILIGLSSLFFMSRTMFAEGTHGKEGFYSLLIGLSIAGSLVLAGMKLGPKVAYGLLLFLAIQTALNALSDTLFLIQLSLGIYRSDSFSDATNMAQLTGLPAGFWSLIWGALSLLMVFTTLRLAYSKQEQA